MEKVTTAINEQYKHLLNQGEEILWYLKDENTLGVPKGLLIGIITVMFPIGLYISFLMDYNLIHTLLLTIFLFMIIYIGIENSYLYQKNYTYLVTNERFIFENTDKNKEQSTKSYSHYSIYKIYPLGNNLVLHNKPPISFQEFNYPCIKNALKYESDYSEIINTWFKKSVFSDYINSFNDIANKYSLIFDEQKAINQYAIHTKGNLNGMPLLFEIDDVREIKNISILIKCPNSEKNNLHIGKEKSTQQLLKHLGMEDIKIGDDLFDKKFIIQSKSKAFLTSILDNKMRESIQKANSYMNGQIEINEKAPKKAKPITKKISEDILDADMFQDELEIKSISKGHISNLKYHFNSNSEYETKKLIPHSINVLEMMIQLAKNIQSYNKV